MYTLKVKKFLIHLSKFVYGEPRYNWYKRNPAPTMLFLRGHITSANNKLNEPFTTAELPQLYDNMEIFQSYTTQAVNPVCRSQWLSTL